MLGAIFRLRAQLRARWCAWLVVALFIGVGGGVVLTTAAGARRTASAYDRYLHVSHGADFLVSPDQTGFPHLYADLARATGAQVTPVIGYGMAPLHSLDVPVLVMASPEARFGTLVERPKVVAGRLPDLANPWEVLADTTSARVLRLRPGSHLHMRVARRDEELPSPRDDEVTLDIVGIGVTRDNVESVNALATAPTMLATPAFARHFGPDHYAFDGAEVTLAPGETKPAFAATAQAIARHLPETGGNLEVADEAEQAGKVDHAIRPEAVALALFALLTALITLFAISQLTNRQLFLVSTDNAVLRALGMTRRQLLGIETTQVAGAAVIGALIAVVTAVMASTTMPIGPARTAEPSPGVSFDGFVLGSGFAIIIVAVLACAAWPAWRYASRGHESTAIDPVSRRRSTGRSVATAIGASPNMAIGIRHAVETGRGRSAVPSRATIAVTALAVAAIAASATFGTNLSRLVHTPRLYGQGWDVTVDAQFSPLPANQIDGLLRTLPGVAAWTYGTHTDLVINRTIIPAIALVAGGHGFLTPTIVAGRPAEGPGDVMLGTKTLDEIHRNVGDTITGTLAQPGTQSPPLEHLRVVGRGVFPFLGEGSFTPTGLGVGAQVTEAAPGANSQLPLSVVLISVAPGAAHDREVAGVTSAFDRAHICGVYNQCTTSTEIRPTDVLNYARVRQTPIALAAVVALIAIGVIANLLVASIRRRRYDYAVLKTLGVTRRGISATVAAQATTLMGLALLFGLPIGVALGRSIWGAFANGLGIPNHPRTPGLTLLIAAVVGLVLVNAMASVPGYFAARTAPAQILASE